MAESIGRSDRGESKCDGARNETNRKEKRRTTKKWHTFIILSLFVYEMEQQFFGPRAYGFNCRYIRTREELPRRKQCALGTNSSDVIACHGLRNSYLAFRVFIFSHFFSPLDSLSMFDVLTLFVRTRRKSQRAIYLWATLRFTRQAVCVCVCAMPYGSVYHSIIILPQHVSKRQKVKNTERFREIRMRCAVEPPGDALTHKHSTRFHNRHRIVIVVSLPPSPQRPMMILPHQDRHLPRRKIIMWL